MLIIHAPYTRCDATSAAIRLATFGIEQDWEVRYFAALDHHEGVHPYWDEHVLTCRNRFKEATGQAKQVVWFVPNKNRFLAATRKNSRIKHILVPDPHTLDNRDIVWMHWHDKVICASQPLASAMQNVSAKLRRVAEHCPWDSGYLPVQVEKKTNGHAVNVFVAVGNYTQQTHDKQIVDTVEMLLTNNPDVRITLSFSRSWPRHARQRLNRIKSVAGGRLQTLHTRSISEHFKSAMSHDMALCLDVRTGYGVDAAKYCDLGLPLVAWGVEPFASHIVEGDNGALVDCDVKQNMLGGGEAVWDTRQVVSLTTRLLQEPHRIDEMTAKIEPTSKQEFDSYWLNILEG